MSQSKREQVVSHLRYIRQELREMHQGVMEDGLLPEAGEVTLASAALPPCPRKPFLVFLCRPHHPAPASAVGFFIGIPYMWRQTAASTPEMV